MIWTNLSKITHDSRETFVLEVGLGGSYTRSRGVVANVIPAILVGCSGPSGLVNTRHDRRNERTMRIKKALVRPGQQAREARGRMVKEWEH